MEPSSSKLWVWLDRFALAGLVGGIGLYMISLKVGFFATAAFTVLHIVTSHVRK